MFSHLLGRTIRAELLFIAIPVLLFSACSKTSTGPATTTTPELGELKRPGNDIVVVWPKDAKTTSFNLSVTTECACPYGTLTCTGSPMGSEILEQSDTRLFVEGESPYSDPAGTSYCILEKGPNADTPGPVYYITPEGSGRILSIQVRSSEELPDDRAWFTYYEGTNAWEAHETASTYFNWSVLGAPPEDCCEEH